MHRTVGATSRSIFWYFLAETLPLVLAAAVLYEVVIEHANRTTRRQLSVRH